MFKELINLVSYNPYNNVFKIRVDSYGVNDTERCIEIPWTLSCYKGEKRVLDVGYANAEDRYISELIGLGIPELYGLDMVKKELKGITSCQGDIRKTSFDDGFFDLILCISTIEHIGMDNSIYFNNKETDNNGDFTAIKEMGRILKKGGKMALTVPYGKFYDYGWFIHYDEDRWSRLIKESGCKVLIEDYFLYNDGWKQAEKSELEHILYKDNGAPAATGLACVLLKK